MNAWNNGNLTGSVPSEIRVETRILGWGSETIRVPLPGGRDTLADLIRAKIGAEWGAFERGERAEVGRESLPPEMLDRRSVAAPPPGLEAAVRAAVDGYRSGWYIVLVDGVEPGGLDTRLDLTPETSVSFVRVYPLPDAPARPGLPTQPAPEGDRS